MILPPRHVSRAARTLALVAVSATAVVGVAATGQVLAWSAPAPQARILADPTVSVPDSYIVKTREGSSTTRALKLDETRRVMEVTAERARRSGATITREYDAVGGFTATLTQDQLDELRRDPNVEYVQRNGKHNLLDMMGGETSTSTPETPGTRAGGTQNNPTWGLDRIDQKNLPLDKKYTYPYSGKGVNVYIMDTGITSKHVEFTGRLKGGMGWSKDGSTYEDCQGHGSHVAGTAAGKTYGVAKDANIYALRIFECNGDNKDEDTMSAVNWMMKNGQKPAVVNMSFSDDKVGAGSAVDLAIQKLPVEYGIHVAVAAGNQSKDACLRGPAWVPEMITVGNATNKDGFASTSNYGRCVDFSAPGTDITSVEFKTTSGTSVKSGTSMASPHVAGAVAVYLEANPQSTPAQTHDALARLATPNVIKAPSGTNASLLNVSGYAPSGPPPGPQPQPQPTQPAPWPTQPAPQPTQPAPWPTQPQPQPTRPPQPTQPAPWPTQPQPTRPPQPTQPAPWPTQPAPQPTQPAPWPTVPQPQPTQPAPQPTQPAPQPTQPAPQPTRPRPTWPGMPGMPGQP